MKISVVIPVYNAEIYIDRTINSLFNQTIGVDEIIVVDDGSNDETLSIVKELMTKDVRIKVFQQQNSGASAARNRGVIEATGDWILFLDADDLCGEKLIESYKKYLLEHAVDAIYSQFIQIDENDSKISDILAGRTLAGDEGFCTMLLRNPIIAPSGSLIKKESLVKLNLFDTNIRYVEDVDFWLRLLLADGRIGHVEQPLSYIRRHSNNTTNSISITNTGEQTLLNKYGLKLISGKLYNRNVSKNKNHLDYANFLIRYKKDTEALEILNLIDLSPIEDGYITYLFIKAIVNLNLNNLIEAKQLFNEVNLQDSNHGAALNNRAVLYAKHGETSEAEEMFKQAINLFPGYMDATDNLRVLHEGVGEYRFTKRELRKNLLRYS